MGIGPELLGGIAGTVLGSAVGGRGGSGDNYGQLYSQYNAILNNALQQAINSSTNYTNQAVDQQNQSLNAATGSFNNGYNNALQQLISNTTGGFNIGQGLLTPYRDAGYAANDAYSQSLGLATPVGGSQTQADAAAKKAQANLYAQQVFGAGGLPTGSSILTSPTSPNSISVDPSSISQKQVQDYITHNISTIAGGNGEFNYDGVGNQYIRRGTTDQIVADPRIQQAVSQLLSQQQAQQQNAAAQQQYQTQQTAYQNQQNQLGQYNNYIQQIGYDPNAVTPTGMTGGVGATVNPGNSTQSGNNPGLQNFLNSPEYQALFGSGAGTKYAQDGTYDPTQAFANDPGTQFKLEQGMKLINQQAASKGLLSSGNVQQGLMNYALGTEDQQYQTYQNNLAGLFGNYQNNLAQLTNLGSGLTGANTAASLFSNIGNQAGQYAFGTGSNIANANLATGSNISSLYGNQGSLNASAYLNTGAAQANGLLNIAGMNAQANATQAASQAQQYSANAANQGSMQALQQIMPYLQQQQGGQNLFGRTGGTF